MAATPKSSIRERLEHPGTWSARQLSGQLLYFLVWLGITFFGIWLQPSRAGHGTHQQLGLPPCPLVLLYGRPCPGCGLTTCVSAVLHGDLPAAWNAHPLGLILYLGFSATALWAGHRFWRRIRIRTELPAMNWAAAAVMVAILLFGGVRFALSPQYGTWAELAYGLPKP